MFNSRRLVVLGLAAFAGLFLLVGCGPPATQLSSNPKDQMNPAMTDHQKAVRLARSQKN